MSVSTRSTFPSSSISRASRPLIAKVTSNPKSRSISRNISARPNSSSTIRIDCLLGTTLRLRLLTASTGVAAAGYHTRLAGKRIEQANPAVGDPDLAHRGVVVVVADLQNRQYPPHHRPVLDMTEQNDVLCRRRQPVDRHFNRLCEQLPCLGAVDCRQAKLFDFLGDRTVDMGHPFGKIGGPFESLDSIQEHPLRPITPEGD